MPIPEEAPFDAVNEWFSEASVDDTPFCMSHQLTEHKLSCILRQALEFLEWFQKAGVFYSLDTLRGEGSVWAFYSEGTSRPPLISKRVWTVEASLISFKWLCLHGLSEIPSSQRTTAFKKRLLLASSFRSIKKLRFLNPSLRECRRAEERIGCLHILDGLKCDASLFGTDGNVEEVREIDKNTMWQLYGPPKLLLDRSSEVPNPLIDSNSVVSAHSSPLLNQPCQMEDSHSGDAPEVAHQHVSLLDQYETPLQSAALLHQPSVEVQSFSDGGPETPIQPSPWRHQCEISLQPVALLDHPNEEQQSCSGLAPETPSPSASLADQPNPKEDAFNGSDPGIPIWPMPLVDRLSLEVRPLSGGGPETPIQSTPLADQPCVAECFFPNVSVAVPSQACGLLDHSEVPVELSCSLQNSHDDAAIAPDGAFKDVSIPEPTPATRQLTPDSPESARQDTCTDEMPLKRQKVASPDHDTRLPEAKESSSNKTSRLKKGSRYSSKNKQNRIGPSWLYRKDDIQLEERVWMQKSPQCCDFTYQKLLRECLKQAAFDRGTPLNVFRTGCQYKVYIRKCRVKELGMGVFAAEDIPRGKAVFEYTGDVLSENEADKREADTGPRFMYNLDECTKYPFVFNPLPQAIDARFAGNATRFLNHSCHPNLALVDSEDFKKYCVWLYGVQRLVFMTTGKVKRGDALTIDYHPHLSKAALRKAERHLKVPCKCGHPRCREWMLAAS